MTDLRGKIALVTGGSRGIGAAIAKELALKGAYVAVNYVRNSDSAERVAAEIRAFGGEVTLFKADVSDSKGAHDLVDAVHKTYGNLHILVNNAGITRDKSFCRMTPEIWQEVLQVNLNSAFYCCASAVPHMIQSGGGNIINISSIIGQSGGFGQSNYAAAKAGMLGFTKSLALELARHHITVNAICPGFINTDMVSDVPDTVLKSIIDKIPLKRLGNAIEIAKGVIYLVCSGSYITGQSININGGMYV